jgi:hypothetical protein
MQGKRPYLRVAQVERERLDRLQSILGGRLNGPYANNGTFSNSKPIHVWTQQRKCDEAVALMWPYLGPTTRKRLRKLYRDAEATK